MVTVLLKYHCMDGGGAMKACTASRIPTILFLCTDPDLDFTYTQ